MVSLYCHHSAANEYILKLQPVFDTVYYLIVTVWQFLYHLWCYLTVESLNQCLTLIVANLLGQLKVSSGREVWKLSCIVQQPGLKKFLKDFVYFFNWTMKKKWFNFQLLVKSLQKLQVFQFIGSFNSPRSHMNSANIHHRISFHFVCLCRMFWAITIFFHGQLKQRFWATKFH